MTALVMRTARLDLIATGIDHLEVEMESPSMLGEMLGAEVPRGWPPGLYDRDAKTFFLKKLTEGGAAAEGWYSWYAVRRAGEDGPAALVGAIGYFGPPSEDGIVEIGYSVAGDHRGKGYCTEMVAAFVQRALATPGVLRVVAEVHEANLASLKVLERNGFRRAGPGRDPGYHRHEWHGSSPA